ncbi:MAG: hypothetical protein ACR2FG_06835 [Marmoricola sp.]
MERGERVAITRNGTRVAILEPAEPDPLDVLIQSGELRPALGSLPLFSEPELFAPDSLGSDAVVADRDAPGRW